MLKLINAAYKCQKTNRMFVKVSRHTNLIKPRLKLDNYSFVVRFIYLLKQFGTQKHQKNHTNNNNSFLRKVHKKEQKRETPDEKKEKEKLYKKKDTAQKNVKNILPQLA